MTQGEIIIIAVRLLVPLLIFRWQIAGGIAAMLVDAADVILIELIGRGGFGDHYAELDKALDSYYLGIELLVSLRWANGYARWPSIILFGYRLIGVLAFELTHARITLFIFPNLFENWWLYCVVVQRFWPRQAPHSAKSVAVPMVLLLIPKMAQEYLLHFAEAEPWDWTKRNVLRM